MFFKIGAFGFGGPVALIGYMENECVQKRKWLNHEDFQKVVGFCKLFPGPLATLISVRLGMLKAGKIGGILAGFFLVFPAFLMILFLSKVAVSFAQDPHFIPMWVGLNLGALAISYFALLQLSKPLFQKNALPIPLLCGIMSTVAVLTYLDPPHEPLFILGTGLIGVIAWKIKSKSTPREVFTPALAFILFFSCFKASLLTFGSGIAIVPVLKSIFVDQYHWVSDQDFLNGLTLGMVTPGPLVITTTFLGFKVGSYVGATITTLGTFLPTFILGLFVVPALEKKLSQMTAFQNFIQWVLPAVCGAIFGSLIKLSLLSLGNFQWQRVTLLGTLCVTLYKFRAHSILILLAGGALALLFRIT